MQEDITKAYIVQKMEHMDAHPTNLGNCLALSEEEVTFIRGHWEEESWGRYCTVIEVKRDLRFVQRNDVLNK